MRHSQFKKAHDAHERATQVNACNVRRLRLQSKRDARTRDMTQSTYTRKTRGTTVDNRFHTNTRGHANKSTRIRQEGRAARRLRSRKHTRPRVHAYATRNKYINPATTNDHTSRRTPSRPRRHAARSPLYTKRSRTTRPTRRLIPCAHTSGARDDTDKTRHAPKRNKT
jgi:hypothetical protein